MLSREGEVGFSVRKLGVSIGVDPMTVLHHFGSKEELLRRIADRALASVELPLPSDNWRADLRNVAVAYRNLAHRHPRIFHLHFRFHATGPADHISSEVVYRALRSAGLRSTPSFWVMPWPRLKGFFGRSAPRTRQSFAHWTRWPARRRLRSSRPSRRSIAMRPSMHLSTPLSMEWRAESKAREPRKGSRLVQSTSRDSEALVYVRFRRRPSPPRGS